MEQTTQTTEQQTAPEETQPVAAEQPVSPAPEAAAPQSTSGEYTLELPGDFPVSKYTEETTSTLTGFNEAALSAGIPHSVASGLVEAFIDAESFIGGTGESEYTVEDATHTMRRIWGESYDAKLGEVRKAVKALGIAKYLDESNLGNDPRTLVALSTYGDMKLSKEQAQAALAELTGSKEYQSGNKSTVMRAKVLGRIA